MWEVTIYGLSFAVLKTTYSILVKNIIAQQITRKRGIFKKHLACNVTKRYSINIFLYTKCFLNMPLLRVICWAIIFLTRIRFPPGVSIGDNYVVFGNVCDFGFCEDDVRMPNNIIDHNDNYDPPSIITS
jgi:hypothetical protein